MRERLLRGWPLLLAGGLAALTWWLANVVLPPDRPPEERRHDPDFIVTDLQSRELDATGTPVRTLDARRLVHYPDTETSELDQPRFERRDADGIRLLGRGQWGTVVGDDGEEIRLSGQAVLERHDPDGATLVLETDHITLWPEQGLAETDAAVRITRDGSSARGVGMKLDDRNRTLELVSQVQVEYRKPKE